VLLLVIVAAAIGFVVYGQLSGSGLTVPTRLKGLTCTQAKQALPNGLTGRCVAVKSSLADQGLVVRTDPGLGSSASSGSVVTLFIGNGPSTVKMPDLKGKTTTEAATALTQAGFTATPQVVSVPSTRYPNGRVVGTTPAAGAAVKRDVPIILRVSNGTVAVPDVSGLSCQDATARLARHRLKPTCQPTPDQTVPKDQVIKTDPPAGQVVVWGTPVTVEVSSGPTLSPVPDVVGLSKNDALTALHGAGFKVQVTRQVDCTDPAANDTVQSQSPQGNTQAPQGSVVQIVVLKYRPADPSCVNPPAT
jgi:serine/threonine-protein kinase